MVEIKSCKIAAKIMKWSIKVQVFWDGHKNLKIEEEAKSKCLSLHCISSGSKTKEPLTNSKIGYFLQLNITRPPYSLEIKSKNSFQIVKINADTNIIVSK